jgi:hypothetical protein
MPSNNPLLPGDDNGPPAISGAPQAAQPKLSLAELVEGLHKTAYVNAKMKELLLRKEPPSKKDIFNMSSDLVEHGALTPQRIAGELASMPQNADMLKPWLFTHYMTTEQQMDQIAQMIHEESAAQDQQQQPQMGQPPMMGGAPPPAAASPMGGQPMPPANRLMPNGGQQ